MIAIYLRVSTARQETDSQRAAIENWCRMCSYNPSKILEYVDDGHSGKTIERPAFRQMMADIAAGKIKKVITFELSRLSRNFLDTLFVMRTLTEAGVSVEVPGEGAVQFDNTLEQFMVAARGLVGAQERERISARTKAGLMAAKARGVRLGAKVGEKRKLGWRKDYLVSEPRTVEKIIAKRRRGRSYSEIADDLNISVNKAYRLASRYISAGAVSATNEISARRQLASPVISL